MPALGDVLDALARAVVPDGDAPMPLGAVVLRPHQARAVRLLCAALDEFGGALLADDVGLGKTFVALAVAAGYPRRIVAAPAALRTTWRDATARAGVPVDFISLEALSRRRVPAPAPLVIVDEAHRAATRTTIRYRQLAWVAHGARVLLLTATPVRNRTAEIEALLALFLGPAAATADAAVLSRCVIHRAHDLVERHRPAIHAHRAWRPRGNAGVAAALSALPPPAALDNGHDAAGLVRTSLARCWASSAQALHQALVRRLQRGAAIGATLDAGRVPDRASLAAWTLGDDAMQLVFPFPGGHVVPRDLRAMRDALARHLDAVRALQAAVRPLVGADTAWRAERLRALLRRHPDAVVVAFSVLEATVAALFSRLRREPGVVLLSGRGARSGAGPLDRDDVLGALASDHARHAVPHHLRVRLVLATDLLAEGVNLQVASVIVHLDDPWTPTAMAQRVGRAARMGSAHATVHVHRFAPSPDAAALIGIDSRHAAKIAAAREALVPSKAAEALRRTAAGWLGAAAPYPRAVAAAVEAPRRGVLARVDRAGAPALVAGRERATGGWTWSDDPRRILRAVAAVTQQELARPAIEEVNAATRSVLRWTNSRAARDESGLAARASPGRLRVLERMMACVDRLPAVAFAANAARFAALRRRIAVARGAALEAGFEELARESMPDADWLARLEALVASASRQGASAERPSARGAEVVAMLFLRGGGLTARSAPLPSPAPPAAGSGTAAPR